MAGWPGLDVRIAAVTASPTAPRTTSLAELGEWLAALRLCEASALDAMRRALERHGQLSPIVATSKGSSGCARRALGWSSVAITVVSFAHADGLTSTVWR
jgi:hypothetical protein